MLAAALVCLVLVIYRNFCDRRKDEYTPNRFAATSLRLRATAGKPGTDTAAGRAESAPDAEVPWYCSPDADKPKDVMCGC